MDVTDSTVAEERQSALTSNMATIFTESVGKVVAVQDATTVANISPPLADLSFESQGAIITRLAISEECSQQFMHTLGKFIYVYTFGDRMGMIQISGLVFSQKCEGTGGIDKVRQYYQQNRLAVKSDPVRITIGTGTTVEAFLVKFTGDTSDPASKIFQFDLQFALIPEET